MRESISLVKGKNLGAGEGSFNHIASGYDAGYYGYVWYTLRATSQLLTARGSYTYSLVFAADMYATIFKKDPLDPQRGKLYREKILGPGGSRDEIDSLKVRYASACLPTREADHWIALHCRTSSVGHRMQMRSSRSSSAARSRPFMAQTPLPQLSYILRTLLDTCSILTHPRHTQLAANLEVCWAVGLGCAAVSSRAGISLPHDGTKCRCYR